MSDLKQATLRTIRKLTDPSGIAYAVEYNLDNPRKYMYLSKIPYDGKDVVAMTNFFINYIDRVNTTEEQRKLYPENNIYGHGKDRYDTVMEYMKQSKPGEYTERMAWEALIKTIQEPGKAITSNTQWSIMYNITERKLKMVFRRHFEKTWVYDLMAQKLTNGENDEWMKEYYEKTRK